MMRFSYSMTRVALVSMSVVGCLVVAWQLWPPVSRWHRQRLAEQLAQHVEHAESDTARVSLRRLANLGIPALRPLIILSSSSHADIANLARQTVDGKMASWLLQAEVNPDFDMATPTTTLAVALADGIKRFDPAGKRWAEHLALQMLQLSEKLPIGKAPKLLDACDQILVAIPARGPRMRTVSPVAQQRLPFNELRTPDVQLDALAVPSESSLGFVSSPSVEKALETATPLLDSSDGTDVDMVFQEPLPANPLRQPGQPDWSPKWIARHKARESLPPRSRKPPPASDGSNRSAAAKVLDVPTPSDMEQRQEKLSNVPTKQLAERLPTAEFYEAAAIRSVLRERGYTDAEVALVQQLSSKLVADRIQLIDHLAELPAGTARRWLRELLDDDSAEVRYKALSALATTSDPDLYDLARELAIEDQDTRVSDLASRIMRQVR